MEAAAIKKTKFCHSPKRFGKEFEGNLSSEKVSLKKLCLISYLSSLK